MHENRSLVILLGKIAQERVGRGQGPLKLFWKEGYVTGVNVPKFVIFSTCYRLAISSGFEGIPQVVSSSRQETREHKMAGKWA